MANINPGEIIHDIQKAATTIIGKDLTTIEGFSRDQLLRIEKLGIKLAAMIAAGEFKDDPEGQQDFLGILEDLITNFANTLKGLSIITIEKVWNAAVKIVWGALDKATGLALPRPVGGP